MGARVVIDGPAEFVRGFPVPISVRVLDGDDEPVTASAWTATLGRAGQVVQTQTGTGAPLWTATAPASWALSDDYLISWDVVVGGVHLHARGAALVARSLLTQTLTIGDLEGADVRLKATHPDRVIADTSDLRDFLVKHKGDAWADVLDQLRSRGSRVHLILEPYALKEIHRSTTLARIYRSLVSVLAGDYATQADTYERDAARRWGALSIVQAPPDDAPSSAPVRAAPVPPVFAGGAWDDLPAGRRPASLPYGWRRFRGRG